MNIEKEFEKDFFNKKFVGENQEKQACDYFKSFFLKQKVEIIKEIEKMKIKIKDEGTLMSIEFGKTTIGDIDKMCSKNRDIGFNEALENIKILLTN